jgi:hypothetical protein
MISFYNKFRHLVVGSGKKTLGKDLKSLIVKAVNFINNDVKTHLGIKVALQKKVTFQDNNNKLDSSILGG